VCVCVCVNMYLREKKVCNVNWPRQQVKVASRPGIIQSTHPHDVFLSD